MCTQAISPIMCILEFTLEVTELFWTPCLNLFPSHVSTRFRKKKHGPAKTSESIHSSKGHTARPPIGLKRGSLERQHYGQMLYIKTEGDWLVTKMIWVLHKLRLVWITFRGLSDLKPVIEWGRLKAFDVSPQQRGPSTPIFLLLNAYQMYQGYQGHLHCEVATNANLSVERTDYAHLGKMIPLIALFEGSHSLKNRNNTSVYPKKVCGEVLARATHDSTRKPISDSFRDEMEPEKY